MIRFLLIVLKVKISKLLFVIKYVPDRYKTHRMGNDAVVENGGTLKFVPDSCKNKKISS